MLTTGCICIGDRGLEGVRETGFWKVDYRHMYDLENLPKRDEEGP